MDNENRTPLTPSDVTEQAVNHSGERVIDEFENTPLKNVEEVQLKDGIPLSPATLTEYMPSIDNVVEQPVASPDITPSSDEGEDHDEDEDSKKSERKSGLRGFIQTKAGKVTVAVAGLLAAGGVVAGVKAIPVVGAEGHSPAATSLPNPESTPAVPAEAKDFMNANGSLYTDALATYYAETAYEKANPGQGFVLTQDYATNYNFDSQPFANGETTPLGFTVEKVPASEEVNIDNSIQTFNNSIPNLNKLVNLLAKNPSQDRINAITDEFSKSSGLGNPEAAKLVSTLLSVAQKYGSNANYSINPGTKGQYGTTSETNSVFTADREVIDAVDVNNNVTAYNDVVNLSIEVDTFNDKGEQTKQVDTSLQGVQFSVRRAENYDPGNAGYIGIGLK